MTTATVQAREQTYFAATRAPRYAVLFALPLFVGYEALAATTGGQSGIRNGADVLLRGLFVAIAGNRGSALFMAVLVAAGLAALVFDSRRNPGRLKPTFFAGMFGESVVFAGVFGIVVGLITARLLGAAQSLSVTQALDTAPWPTRLMLSIGAGLYEELFFRVILVSALSMGARVVFGLGRTGAGIFATILGALIFSAFHYIGPLGDTFQIQSFVFRAVSGVAFSALYLVRGFGVTAWTHALYDAFLLLR